MSGPAGSAAPTSWANIYVGLKPGYDGQAQQADAAAAIIQQYVDQVGLCVTMTATRFIYTHGQEPGLIIGLINYPRFPTSPDQIRAHALALGELLRRQLGQLRVSVMFPDETVLLQGG